jgi:hypothetical protein
MQKRKVGSVNSAGVDVGSRELVVRLRPGAGGSEALKFENTPEGHQALLGAIRKMHGRTGLPLRQRGRTTSTSRSPSRGRRGSKSWW